MEIAFSHSIHPHWKQPQYYNHHSQRMTAHQNNRSLGRLMHVLVHLKASAGYATIFYRYSMCHFWQHSPLPLPSYGCSFPAQKKWLSHHCPVTSTNLCLPSFTNPISAAHYRQCCLVERSQDWDTGDLNSILISAPGLLEDLGQVTSMPQFPHL